MGKIFARLMDGAESLASALIQFEHRKPSLLRVITIPIGALIMGFCFALAGIVEEYSDLVADFKRASRAKKV